jgi:hypothetical protein
MKMPSTLQLIGLLAAAGIAALLLATRGAAAAGEPARLAPDPGTTPEAVVQVYGARARGWRGVFGVHTWVAVKPAGAPVYTVYEVIGWRQMRGSPPVVVRNRVPDDPWFGNPPELLADKRGAGVDALIERIDKAVREYPYADEYTLWPGPNSNTFTAWIARAVPELEVDLPPTAIGKDFNGGRLVGRAPSGSGVQLSLFGLFGVTASGVEGVELNVLGLTFGINPFDPALKLPLIGRIGAAR